MTEQVSEPFSEKARTYIRRHTNPPVFFISGVLILAFLIFGAVASGALQDAADAALAGISRYFGWFYVLAATFFLVFVVALLFTRFGRLRLGPDNSRPEYGTLPWFAMLFTAGMGIGLVFFGVAEPLGHFTNEDIMPALGVAPGSEAAATRAMNFTFFHWGLHPWAIYIVLGLSMAYFHFRRGLPLRPAAAFYPLIGERVYGWLGNLIDILAVFGTLFGIATSLGLGARQVNAGLNQLFGVPTGTDWIPTVIIITISLVAIVSVMLGLVKGIRRLSLVNLWLAIGLMAFVFVTGPTLFMLSGLADWTGYYLQNLVSTSFTVFDPATNPAAADWQSTWTLFYWGWWISWSPFVGLFIARISRGRTVRQFIAGALFAPVGASFVWFSVFGGAGLFYDRVIGTNIAGADTAQALYAMLQQLPVGSIVTGIFSLLAVVVVVLFFATSSDSGSLVVDMLTNGGDPNPIRYQRLFWASLEGAVAIVLLVAGGETGLEALQSASITTGLPFAVVLLVMCLALVRGMQQERQPRAGPPFRVPEASSIPEPEQAPSGESVRVPTGAPPEAPPRHAPTGAAPRNTHNHSPEG